VADLQSSLDAQALSRCSRVGVRSCVVAIALIASVGCSNNGQRTIQGSQTGAYTLRWSPCTEVPNAECGGLPVPIDPARPNGAKLTLRIARVPAIDPKRKKGVLVSIPGGPGVGISVMLDPHMRKEQHMDDFRTEYDVVTFDPRGVGKSDPVRCAPDAVPSPAESFANRPLSESEFKAVADRNAAFFRSCFKATGELMRHLSAMDTAADIEQIRRTLTPNAGLVAYAGSYGTQYAQAYLDRYGDHVRALVLDGLLDHSVGLPTIVERQIMAADDAFDRFTRWCRVAANCALHGRSVGAVFDAAGAKVPATRKLVSQLLATGNDPSVGWPMIAKMLAEVNAGESQVLNGLTRTASMASKSEDASIRAGKVGYFLGVLCSDYGPPPDYRILLADWKRVSVAAPRFAWRFWDAYPIAHATFGVGDCAGWPFAASNPPHELAVAAHPNVMVANPTHDPATPLINALSVWPQIPQSRLLIADVDGHQAFILSKCAFKAVARFLRQPASLSSVTICPDSSTRP
jgi:pimeloyl-ACP methyl ester carboxylesterase